MKEYYFCQCGARFRDYAAEAKHRHNFPLLCRRPGTPKSRLTARYPDAVTHVDHVPGCRDLYGVKIGGELVTPRLVGAASHAWRIAEELK